MEAHQNHINIKDLKSECWQKSKQLKIDKSSNKHTAILDKDIS